MKLMAKLLTSSITTHLSNKKNWLSFLLGLSLVFCYAPFSYWWLITLLLPTWLYFLIGLSPKDSAKQGFIFAFAWFASGISWVHVSIDQFGGLPLIFSLLLMMLLCLYLACFLALACYIAAKISSNKSTFLWILLPCWLGMELLRGVLLTGFPWLTLGYSQIDSPLSAFAPIIGERGITSLIIIYSIAIVYIIKNQQRRFHISLIAIIALLSIAANKAIWLTPTDNTVTALLVQGNIKQELKWSPEMTEPTMEKYLQLSQENLPADIIVWPESAITAIEPSLQAQEFIKQIQSSPIFVDSAIITGIINYDLSNKNAYNSLIVIGKYSHEPQYNHQQKNGYHYNNSNRYTKHHLLPVGEFVPFEDLIRPLAPLFNLPMSSFNRGNYVQNNLLANGYHILPLICFEVAFAEQLSANFSNNTDILLTVSNDAWFGDSHGPHQHLDIVRMRALEFGRPFLRATNNGITAAIDHHGNVINSASQFKEATLSTKISLVKGMTPYAKYTRIIDFLLPLLFLFIALFIEFSQKIIYRNANEP